MPARRAAIYWCRPRDAKYAGQQFARHRWTFPDDQPGQRCERCGAIRSGTVPT